MTERPKLRRWLSLDDARAFVDRLATEAVMVDDPASVESMTRDQDDDYLIALARDQEADFLVSGGLDLLEREGDDPAVISPANLEEILAEL